VHPFFMRMETAGGDKRVREYLWPLAADRQFLQERTWRALLMYYQKDDISDVDSDWRFWVVPLYFQGQAPQGKYVGLFPLVGHVYGVMGQDEFQWGLWPLYMNVRRGEKNSRSFLWPFFHVGRGGGLHKNTVWPLAGYSRKEGLLTYWFALWPVVTGVSGTMGGHPVEGLIVMPLAGYTKGGASTRTVYILPPLGRYTTSDHGYVLYAPWPLFARSEDRKTGLDKLHIFPFWGKADYPEIRNRYVLWPLFRSRRVQRPDHVKQDNHGLPFWNTSMCYATNATGDRMVFSRNNLFWPLIAYEREQDITRLHFPELWPFKGKGPIHRNYAAFWTLYAWTKGPEGYSDHDGLWGLWRQQRCGQKYHYFSLFPICSRERDESSLRWDVGKGLLGYERKDGQSAWRVLWIFRFGGKDRHRTEPVTRSNGGGV
jgi:hypothetical protein